MKRKIIPYNPKLKVLANELHKNMTYSEVKLWNQLKRHQMMGYDFDRQKPIGNYIVDFYCKDLLLALEVDGITHHDEYVINKDAIRQEELEALGVHFLRFGALQVVHDMPNVIRAIENWIFDFEDKHGAEERVLKRRTNPPPAPPGRG